jgi:multisubunit Na+/H+ antiporter MnhC subunit
MSITAAALPAAVVDTAVVADIAVLAVGCQLTGV